MPRLVSYEDKVKEGRKARWRKRAVLLVAGTCILVGGAFALWKTKQPPQPAPLPDLARQIVDARAAGQYDRALQLVAEGLRSHSGVPAIRTLAEEFQQELKPHVQMRYLRRGALPSRSPRPGSRLQLTPDDEFYYTVNLLDVPRPCYVYMFLVDSAGEWTVLLPNQAHVPNRNPLPRAVFQVPDNIRKRLRPADTPGVEKLFVVLASWRIGALEDLAAALKDSGRAGALGKRLLARLRLEEAAAPGIPGLSFGTYEFHDSGRISLQGVEKP